MTSPFELHPSSRRCSRRQFHRLAGGCAAYLAASLAGLPGPARRAFAAQARGEVVAESDFARIERLHDGIWAVISTPLRGGGSHFETTSNGGIIQGSHGVMVVEGYMQEAGAAWVAEQTARLTGAEITHIVVTHFHADHCRGLRGLGRVAQYVHGTPTTRSLMAAGEEPMLPGQSLREEGAARIDLGGVVTHLRPRSGHTPSDVTIEVEDPAIVFCGDLLWNEMFPNFVDAIPSHQVRHCEELLGRSGTTYVPGHGNLGDAASEGDYLGLLQDLESAGRRSFEAGTTPEAATAEYTIPESLGTFFQFGGDYVLRAFTAWHRELGDGS